METEKIFSSFFSLAHAHAVGWARDIKKRGKNFLNFSAE
jgi:hypothetical protein